MFDDRQDPGRYESRRPYHAAGSRQLADLDRLARSRHRDGPPGAGRLDAVLASRAAAGVHQDLDKISLRHTSLLCPIRAQLMRYLSVAQPPERARSVVQLKEAAASCQACDLWANATQSVIGEGSVHDRLLHISDKRS